jgi:multicomponent Na+:H+ antiporter subunit G
VNDLSLLWDSIAAVLLVLGAFLSFVAGIGLARFPDLLTRIHSAAKPQVLGLLLMLSGLAFVWRAWVWLPILLFAWALQMVTAPVAAHLVGRAGYRTRHLDRDLLYADELAQVVSSGQHGEGPRPAARADEDRPER